MQFKRDACKKHVIATNLQDIQFTYTQETITNMVLLNGKPICALQVKILLFKFFWKNVKHVWRAV